MAPNSSLFKELNTSYISKVTIGNGESFRRKKLDQRSFQCVILGYNNNKGYRVFDVKTQKVIIAKEIKSGIGTRKLLNLVPKLGLYGSPNCDSKDAVRGTILLLDVCAAEPSCFRDTANLEAWVDIMKDELKMFEKNKTWQLVDRLSHRNELNGFPEPNTIRMLEEEIYIEQLKGFEVKGIEDKVCLLKKALYGLKQCSRKQNKIARSTAEAEYIYAAVALNQVIWLRKTMKDLKQEQVNATQTFRDNQSAVAIAKNLVFHGKTKHKKIKYHFVREAEKGKEVILVHCTKALPRSRFIRLKEAICMSSNCAKEE
eukprot:XP_015579578.1 uncharacterized protein LOC107261874 [Ricinus communis]